MLTINETKELVGLLGKIGSPENGLPQDVFEALSKVVSLPGCEAVIQNNKGEILLTWRDDKWWRGWHFPGGLMRYGETFEGRLKKMLKDEIGDDLDTYKLLFPYSYINIPRGPVVSLIYLCTLKDKPVHGRFFKEMPDDIVDCHREVWQMVKSKLD